MTKKTETNINGDELADNEEFISRDDINIEVMLSDDEPVVYVRFSGFPEYEDAEDYAAFLTDTLPLLLFETTRIQ